MLACARPTTSNANQPTSLAARQDATADPVPPLSSSSLLCTTALNLYSHDILAGPTPPLSLPLPLPLPLQTQIQFAMLANVPSTSNNSAASAVEACDERTRLLSNTPTPPPLMVLAAPSPPTTLSLVHTTSHHNSSSRNNNQNYNNNNADVVSATAAATLTNNNNDNMAAAAGADVDVDDLSEETANTSGAADAADLSDKFPRPHMNQKKPKLGKLGTKSVGLKRVSFGSSKGSMVETLVFETPTPLSEHVEPSFGFDAADAAHMTTANAAAAAAAAAGQAHRQLSHLPLASYSDYAKANMDDSGIELQEESERSIVRVSIYQSSKPQQICPPAATAATADYFLTNFGDNLDNTLSSYNYNIDYTTAMTTAAMQTAGIGPAYDRQQSTDSGWDNPFRPGGDLSREADEIVNMIRGGKPITPTEDRTIGNGNAHGDDNCNGTAIGENVTKTNISQNQATAQNGTNSHGSKNANAASATAASAAATVGGGTAAANNGVTSLAQVSKQTVPGPRSASPVHIGDKKSKKKGCCVVQ